jgi:hypothetical protein
MVAFGKVHSKYGQIPSFSALQPVSVVEWEGAFQWSWWWRECGATGAWIWKRLP